MGAYQSLRFLLTGAEPTAATGGDRGGTTTRNTSEATEFSSILSPFFVKATGEQREVETLHNVYFRNIEVGNLSIATILRIEGKDIRQLHKITLNEGDWTGATVYEWTAGTSDIHAMRVKSFEVTIIAIQELSQSLVGHMGLRYANKMTDVEKQYLKELDEWIS